MYWIYGSFGGGFFPWALNTAYIGEYLRFRYLKCLVVDWLKPIFYRWLRVSLSRLNTHMRFQQVMKKVFKPFTGSPYNVRICSWWKWFGWRIWVSLDDFLDWSSFSQFGKAECSYLNTGATPGYGWVQKMGPRSSKKITRIFRRFDPNFLRSQKQKLTGGCFSYKHYPPWNSTKIRIALENKPSKKEIVIFQPAIFRCKILMFHGM